MADTPGDVDYKLTFTGSYGTLDSTDDDDELHKVGPINMRPRRNSPKTATIIIERNSTTGQIDEGDLCQIYINTYEVFYGHVIDIDEVSESLHLRIEVEDLAAKCEDIWIPDQLYVNSGVADKKLFNIGLSGSTYTTTIT